MTRLTLPGSRKSRRYSSSSESSPEPSHRRKSMSEQVVAALGLGGAAAALTGKKSKDSRSRSRSRDRGGRSRSRGGRDRRHHSSSSSRSRSRGGGDKSNEKIGQALKAAITAGAAEAFRARKEPGGWGGQKGKRILTAAIAAGGVDGLVDRDPDKHSKRHVLGSALAGLATTRVINGPRSQSRGRARSESRGRDGGASGLEKLAGAGGVAALGKMAYDRMRSKSRGRGRSSSSSSYDSRRGPPAQRKRSQSVSDYVNKGLAAVGLKEAADTRDDRRHRDYEDDYSYRSSRGAPRGGGGSRDVGYPVAPVAAGAGAGALAAHQRPRGSSSSSSLSSSDSDLPRSSDEERERKKMRGKELLTAGLATVATIHAAHSVYQGVERRKVRMKALAEGEISEAEAKKEKNKARLKDIASVGIAAIGIKSAVTEWKEMKEKREEMHEFREKQQKHHEKRLRREERERSQSRRRTQSQGPYARYGSAPNLTTPYYGGPGGGGPYYAGGGGQPSTSTYFDGNPYGAVALPPPPPGPPPNMRTY